MSTTGRRERDLGAQSPSFVLREANVLDESGGFSGPLNVHVDAGVVAAVGRNLGDLDVPSVDCSGASSREARSCRSDQSGRSSTDLLDGRANGSDAAYERK